MSFEYHKDAIITGYVDSFCLVCESHLKTKEEIWLHLVQLDHIRNKVANSYMEEYKDDCIRKVKKGYFCAFCNVLLSTTAKVSLHVGQHKHISNKETHSLHRSGDTVLFHDLEIHNKAWNGLVNNTCAICDIDFENDSLHMTEATHILNLVQSQLQFIDKNIFRMIDDSSFQCLTCNSILPLNSIKIHFNGAEHNKLYFNRDIESKTDNEDKIKKTDSKNKTLQKNSEILNKYIDKKMSKKEENKQRVENKSEICLSSVAFSYSNEDNLELFAKANNLQIIQTKSKASDQSQTVKEKLEIITKNIDKVAVKEETKQITENKSETRASSVASSRSNDSIETFLKPNNLQHIQTTNKVYCQPSDKFKTLKEKSEKKTGNIDKEIIKEENKQMADNKSESRVSSVSSSYSNEDSIETFAKANNLQYIQTKNKVYCHPCDVHISPTHKSIRVHTKNKLHKSKIRNAKPMKRVGLEQFVTSICLCEGSGTSVRDVTINLKYCITVFSFFMVMKENDDEMKCAVCEEDFSVAEFEEHKQTPRHVDLQVQTWIIASIESEFIRMIRSDVYHCGYCNSVCSDDDLTVHLSSTGHRESKNYSAWRLVSYLQEIRLNNVERVDMMDALGAMEK